MPETVIGRQGVQILDGSAPIPIDPTGLATDANQALQITAEQAILAKIIAAPATSAKQDTLLAAVTKVGATTVVGITEVDTYVTGASSSHTITAGALAIAVHFSSDFTGTVQGATYTSANQGIDLSRVAQPGNLLPALAIVRSEGTFDYYVVTPT